MRLWRQCWQLLEPILLSELSVTERLEDLPRPGVPARITADQRCQIEDLACEQPEKSGRPITHWTSREIADELIHRQIVDHISPRHAGWLLKEGDLKPHLIRYWLTSGDDVLAVRLSTVGIWNTIINAWHNASLRSFYVGQLWGKCYQHLSHCFIPLSLDFYFLNPCNYQDLFFPPSITLIAYGLFQIMRLCL